MPELPEVESIRRKLEPSLISRTIVSVRLLLPRIVETPTPKKFSTMLVNRKIVRSHRIGKYLFYELDNGKFLHFHLRMTGRLLIGNEQPKFARIEFLLDDGKQLWFDDTRTLGRVACYPAIPEAVANLVDAVNDRYTFSDLFTKFKQRSVALKDVLLDQKFLAGIGNIYACEICFRAGISPYRPANRVKKGEAERINQAIQDVMAEAIAAEGTTFSDFRGADGKPGNYQLQLGVYDRAGKPCRNCGSLIEKRMHHNRGTYHCPKCQK